VIAPSTPHLRLENRHTGEVLTLRRLQRDGRPILELRGTLPPHRGGPPLHIHHLEDEEGVVAAGTLAADVGGRRVTVQTGGRVELPRGVPHRWWNGGEDVLHFDGTAHPVADLDRYLQAVFEVLNAGTPSRPPLFYIAHLSLRHRQTQTVLIMPPVVQAVVFRVVVAVGTLIGRYRGTGWPGCPARCTGAPQI
jgi:mannose-6-phosphate isomerase-like protein (cupin superfamily)